jgi:DNA-binding response OmpR family regulator
MNKNQVQRILLIEDDPADARLVRTALQDTEAGNIHLAHCTSLAEAQRLLESEGSDLVLLDLGLPDSTGLTAISEIDRVSPQTPIIVLTGTDDGDSALDALRLGAQDHVVKGHFTGDGLLRAARYALERQRTVNLRSDLLKGIARQLKTPVDALLASVQILLESNGNSLTDRQERMLERTRNTTETLRRFYDGMLDLARADEGPLRYATNGLGGASVIAEIKRRITSCLNTTDGNGAPPTHAFGEVSPAETDRPNALRMLLLEDNPGDARLVAEIISEADLAVELETSVCLSDSIRRLEQCSYDVVLVDLGLPDASALEAVSEVTRLAPRASIIVLTGRDDDTAAAEALKKGAQDYLIKGQVDADVLMRSIRFARERQRTVNLRAELLEAIAYELRSPVHVVLGYAHLLLEKVPDPLTPEQAQTLGNVLATTRTLRRLSEAMLDLAGAEKGPLRLELLNANAAEVIEEIKRRMTLLLAGGGEPDGMPYRMPSQTPGTPAGPGRLFRRMLRRLRKRPKQVLLVDPDYDSRMIIRTALESGAFDVIEATDQAEVLSHLVSDKIGLAVLERRTPYLSTPEVFDEVCKVATFFEVPMLFLDAHQKSNGSQVLLDHRINKPFTPEQFLFAVDHVMGRA